MFIAVGIAVSVLIMAGTVPASHPLITDDTGTQGKGRFQLEINGEYVNDSDKGIKTRTTQLSSTLTCGISGPLDIVFSVPYQHLKIEDPGGAETRTSGVSDASLEMKWRFYEKGGLSFALKPGITFPTGDDKKGLGAGKAAYHLFLIGSKEISPWAFHLNVGYMRNENNNEERENLLHASLATAVEIRKDLKIVGNIGVESDADRASHNHPAFILGGLIYSLSENLELDCGIKGGLTKPETDYAVLAGITYRF
jgi:hypothetical protein